MGEIKRFMKWFRRARDKYLASPEDLNRGLANAEALMKTLDELQPGRYTKQIDSARKVIHGLREAAAVWSVLDNDGTD